MKKHLKFAGFTVFVFLLTACNEKKKDDYNRTELLNNLFSTIIVPNHNAFQTVTASLKTAADAFLINQDAAKLDALRSAFLLSYTKLMAVEVYDFAPSSTLRASLNTFPADTVQINSNILSGSYNLSAVSNLRAKGFPALDYLLFADAGNVLSKFAADANRRQYLNDLVNDISTTATNATTAWNAYQTSFVNASGTDIGSSVGMLVNDMSFESERNRRERVGNALGYIGIVSGGVLSPGSLEGYYSSYSKELLIENLQQLKWLYEGGSSTGFDDYLSFVGADYNGVPLATEITNQFSRTIAAAQAVPVDYATALTSNNSEMQTLFIELKRLTVLLKVDMSSQLGVIINYSDNDGD